MRILVADFDDARGKAHAEALAARGYVVDRVPHGAAALEVALERVPDVLIAPIDLPVIEGERLAEILRGNPRTRHVSFLFFVQDELDAPMGMDPRDGFVVAPWSEEDVLEHIESAGERAPRAEERSDTEIEGKLTQISLVDLLQIFQMNKRSGSVRIWRSGAGGSGTILVQNGQILDAKVPLADGSRIVGEKALYRLLTWREGRFEFVPGDVPDGGRIHKPSRALLLEGMRQMDEWDKLRRRLPGSGVRLMLDCPRDEVDKGGEALVAEVLDAVEAYRRVGEVVDHCPYPDYFVMQTVHELLEQGVLARDTTSDAPVTGGQRQEGVFSPSQLRRLSEWAQREQPGGVVKVLVLISGADEVRDFHAALRECPDFMSDPRVVRMPDRLGRLATLGHFPLGEGASVRLIALPADPLYTHLREVAAHGMLGAIVLPRAPFGPGLEGTEKALQRMQELAPSRTVQLIVQGSNDDLTDGVRARLGELEGGAVFVLPPDGSTNRTSVLRNVFSRIVP